MNKVAKVDKNFDFETKIKRDDVVFYDAKKEPFAVFGLIEEDGVLKRMKTKDAKEIGEVIGVIDYEHVSFSYNDNEVVLDDINIHINAGKSIALVGPSGGG